MSRNPAWTSYDVGRTLSLEAWQYPDGKVTVKPEPTTNVKFDSLISFSGNFTYGEVIDYITINMIAGTTYTFLAGGSYQVNLAIYDNAGYLLIYTDGDDVGFPDKYPQDSIINFVADYTGEHRLSIFYSNVTATGYYVIAGSADYGSNGKNDSIAEGIGIAEMTLLRGPVSNLTATLSADVYAELIPYSTAIAKLVAAADATTSVATLSYLFFTGAIPSQGGIDYLVAPTGGNTNNLNSAYYQSFNLENRYINFAVNLGKSGEGKDAFAAKYGALTLFEATREAYKTIFGAAPVDAKVHALIDTRVDYFASYGGDGPNGIGTKAAMVGWLLAEAEKGDVGVMARSNAAWLVDLSDASAPFAVNILDPALGYYRTEFIFGG